MKSQKLLVIAAIVCLLVGASGTAMAVDTCVDGVIQGTEDEPLTVDSIVVNGQSCFVHHVIVQGDVTVTNSEDFSMVDCKVEGSVSVKQSGSVIILANTVGIVEGDLATRSNLVVSRNDRAWILLNIVTGSTRVIRNSKADVKKNGVAINLLCLGNRRLDSFQNEVGVEELCR
jgi:hypothetical protein